MINRRLKKINVRLGAGVVTPNRMKLKWDEAPQRFFALLRMTDETVDMPWMDFRLAG